MKGSNTAGRITIVLVGATLAALLITDAALFRQNAELKAEVATGGRSLQPPIGKHVPGLRGIDFSGRKADFEYGPDARDTIIFVTSPGCNICQRVMPTWEALLPNIDRNRFRPVLVSAFTSPNMLGSQANPFGDFAGFAELDPACAVALNLQFAPK